MIRTDLHGTMGSNYYKMIKSMIGNKQESVFNYTGIIRHAMEP